MPFGFILRRRRRRRRPFERNERALRKGARPGDARGIKACVTFTYTRTRARTSSRTTRTLARARAVRNRRNKRINGSNVGNIHEARREGESNRRSFVIRNERSYSLVTRASLRFAIRGIRDARNYYDYGDCVTRLRIASNSTSIRIPEILTGRRIHRFATNTGSFSRWIFLATDRYATARKIFPRCVIERYPYIAARSK